MQWASNKCGGKRFRTLPDYRIEIEDQGVPTYPPGSIEYSQLERTWKNWGGLIRKYARKNGIPPSYVLAIATKETGLWSADKKRQASMGSPAGAQGIMQVMPCSVFTNGRFKDVVCGKDRTNPEQSIKMGATILADHLTFFQGFPEAATVYNSGSVRCFEVTSNPAVVPNQFKWLNEHDYVTKAITFNNTAVQMGVNVAPLWPWIAGGVAIAGSALFFVHTKRLPLPRRLERAMS